MQSENVKRFIEQKLEEMEEQAVQEHFLEQANARIGGEASFMLNKLAQRLGLSRSGMAGQLLETAIYDAWFLADMPTVEVADSDVKLPAFFGEGELREEYKAFMAERGVETRP